MKNTQVVRLFILSKRPFPPEFMSPTIFFCEGLRYGLPVRLPYIVITCARIDLIKCVCSEPPCCSSAFLDLLSIHDNFGDKDGILGLFYCGQSERNS